MEVYGKVISSEIKFEWEYYTPSIVYEYSINGSTRTGTKVRPFLVKYNWAGPARRLCERYRAGEIVKVFVDPGDLSSSVLENEDGSVPVILALGACLIFAGILLLWIGR